MKRRIKRRSALVDFTYVVTKDVAETLERKIGYKLTNSTKKEIKSLEDRFLFDFWQYVPENIDKTAIDVSCVSKRLESMTGRNGYPVVSLDRVYLTNADKYLEVTRMTNPKTGEIIIAERPGSKPLKEQIECLKKYEKIVLADAGAFEGGTLIEICDMLESQEIEIEEIYLGFSSNEANKRINNRRKLTALNLFDFYEWVELRDLVGIDGRNVGMSNGIREYMPYSEALPKWASIPKENGFRAALVCDLYYDVLLDLLRKDGCDIQKLGKRVQYKGDGRTPRAYCVSGEVYDDDECGCH